MILLIYYLLISESDRRGLSYQDVQGSSSNFSGTQITSNSLVRPIGITAIPVPDRENFNSKFRRSCSHQKGGKDDHIFLNGG